MSKSSLIVAGKEVQVSDLVSARAFVAGKFGITLPPVAKGEKGITMKELKVKVLALGKTEAEFKLASKEYDGVRNTHYRNSALITGQLAADPTVRKSLRVSMNKAGECIGATTTFRREKSASMTQAARITQLEQMLATATARLALTPAQA